MEFIWNCMMLPIEIFLGIFFWFIFCSGLSILFWLVLIFLKWIIPDADEESKKPKREKYQGKPIIIKGGKDAK